MYESGSSKRTSVISSGSLTTEARLQPHHLNRLQVYVAPVR